MWIKDVSINFLLKNGKHDINLKLIKLCLPDVMETGRFSFCLLFRASHTEEHTVAHEAAIHRRCAIRYTRHIRMGRMRILTRTGHQTAYVLFVLYIHAFRRLFVFCWPLFARFFLIQHDMPAKNPTKISSGESKNTDCILMTDSGLSRICGLPSYGYRSVVGLYV